MPSPKPNRPSYREQRDRLLQMAKKQLLARKAKGNIDTKAKKMVLKFWRIQRLKRWGNSREAWVSLDRVERAVSLRKKLREIGIFLKPNETSPALDTVDSAAFIYEDNSKGPYPSSKRTYSLAIDDFVSARKNGVPLPTTADELIDFVDKMHQHRFGSELDYEKRTAIRNAESIYQFNSRLNIHFLGFLKRRRREGTEYDPKSRDILIELFLSDVEVIRVIHSAIPKIQALVRKTVTPPAADELLSIREKVHNFDTLPASDRTAVIRDFRLEELGKKSVRLLSDQLEEKPASSPPAELSPLMKLIFASIAPSQNRMREEKRVVFEWFSAAMKSPLFRKTLARKLMEQYG